MIRFLSLIVCLVASFSFAQLSPEQVANNAVTEWLAQERLSIQSLSGLPLDDACVALPDVLNAPPDGLDVNLNTPNSETLQGEPDSQNILRFSYPASQPGEILGSVRVDLIQEQDAWQLASIRYLPELGEDALRTWLSGPVGAVVFSLFSILIIYYSIRKSRFRAVLTEGISYLKQHKRITIFSIALLYGLFALGYVAGTGLSQPCGDFLTSLVRQSIEQLGVAEAAVNGDVMGLSAGIFYQNFTLGTLVTTLIPASLFGIPAYLFNGSRFFALALLFGYNGLGGFLGVILALILFIVELMAYILVTAGGGMFLMTIIREGFKSFRLASRKLFLMVPIAMVLLIIGAWYESIIIILPALLAGTP